MALCTKVYMMVCCCCCVICIFVNTHFWIYLLNCNQIKSNAPNFVKNIFYILRTYFVLIHSYFWVFKSSLRFNTYIYEHVRLILLSRNMQIFFISVCSVNFLFPAILPLLVCDPMYRGKIYMWDSSAIKAPINECVGFSVKCVLSSLQFTLYCVQRKVCNLPYVVFSVQCAVCNLRCAVCSVSRCFE